MTTLQKQKTDNLRLPILDFDELKRKVDFIRKDVVDISTKNGAGHLAPSLSSIEILTTLYYHIMNLTKDPEWEKRDRLVFSKAHGCYGIYAILADIGYLARKDWKTFYNGSFLRGCIEQSLPHGIEASCGSLGHGLPQAVGIAYGAKVQNKDYRVYCIVGDGEMQEGSNWEAIQFATKHQLSNLTIIIDQNGLQAMEPLEDILTIKGRTDDLEKKFLAFGMSVKKCDGHNVKEISEAIDSWIQNISKNHSPQLLLAKTIKGYGLTCMENIAKFHFRTPTEDELKMGKRYE
jgi:transketolase